MSAARRPEADFVAAALPIFVGEAQEQTEAIEQLLLRLEEHPLERESLDALFRSAHTVKGSASIFGLERLVVFTHQVESLLDRLRNGEFVFDAALGTVLLRCNDEIRALVAQAGQPGEEAPEAQERRDALVAQLHARWGLQASVADAASAAGGRGPMGDARGATGAMRGWTIKARFGADTFRNGMDPLAILGYLEKLGTVPRATLDVDAVPPFEQLDPEVCHLGVDLTLVADTEHAPVTRAQIESAFTFVRDDCSLFILEPQSGPGDTVRRIESLPDKPRVGDILVGVGAISQAQLTQALQEQTAAPGGAAAPLGEVLKNTAGVNPRVVEAVLEHQQRGRAGAEGGKAPAIEDQRFIRVQADRLDAVINLLGELVIASAGATMLAQQTRQRALGKANQQVARLIEEIRNSTLQLRMVPIGETFSRFRRVVRDTATELGKEVALELQGGETELDKSVVERIADPLMHLVRNALDHGLEPPAERVAAGKPAQGRLRLSARHESGNIVIRIDDDGRGIPRDKVLERARERGLVGRDAVPADAELFKLIFEPGFSTAERVTNLSGRGVGMDVVRRNIEGLRGSIDIDSRDGQGCGVEVRLPLTLAIIDGFLVGVGCSKFIFPLDAVVEVVENRAAVSGLDARGRGVAELRGQTLPVLSLHTFFELDAQPSERASVVVLQAAGRRYGVIVDQLLGQHQTVIKPLGRMLRSLRGMSGSSILGNGEVALIFDAAALSQLAADACGSSPRPITPGATCAKPPTSIREGQPT